MIKYYPLNYTFKRYFTDSNLCFLSSYALEVTDAEYWALKYLANTGFSLWKQTAYWCDLWYRHTPPSHMQYSSEYRRITQPLHHVHGGMHEVPLQACFKPTEEQLSHLQQCQVHAWKCSIYSIVDKNISQLK